MSLKHIIHTNSDKTKTYQQQRLRKPSTRTKTAVKRRATPFVRMPLDSSLMICTVLHIRWREFSGPCFWIDLVKRLQDYFLPYSVPFYFNKHIFSYLIVYHSFLLKFEFEYKYDLYLHYIIRHSFIPHFCYPMVLFVYSIYIGMPL